MAQEINLTIKTENQGVEESLTGINSMRKELKALRDELGKLPADSEAFSEVAAKAGQLDNRIKDVQKTIAAQSGEPIEKLSGSFDLLSNKVKNLDFKGATSAIGGISNTVKNLSFKSITEGIGGFTQQLGQLGKAILSNPILLLATVVIGVGVAIYELKGKIKPISDLFKLFGDVVDTVVQSVKDFTDALGLSTFAADDASTKVAEASKKQADSVVDSYDRQIKIVAAAGKATFDLEKEKAFLAGQAALAQKQALEDIIARGTELTDEQKKQLAEATKAVSDSFTEIQVLDAKAKKEEEDRQKDADKKAEDQRKKAQEKFIADKKSADDAFTKLNEKTQQDLLTQQAVTDQQKLDLEKSRAEKEIKLIEDNALKYAKTQEEKTAITAKANDDLSILNETFALKQQALDQKTADEKKKLLEKQQQDLEKAKEDELKTESELANFKLKQIQDELANKDFSTKTKLGLIQQELDATIAAAQAERDAKLAPVQAEIDALLAKQQTKAGLDETELQTLQTLNEQKQLINDQANQTELDATQKTEDEKKALRQQTVDQSLEITSAYLNAAQGLTEAFFAFQLRGVKKGSEEEIKIRKKMFQVDKAFSIARAVIDGIRSVQAALTIPPPAGEILAVANGILAAANVAKIAATKFDPGGGGGGESGGGGGSTGGGSASSSSLGGGAIVPPVPTATTFNQSTVGAAGTTSNAQNPQAPIRVVVVESDITRTQNRVSTVEAQARI